MSHDTWMHRLVRPLVRPLVTSALEPDHVTWARIATGVAAALALAVGDDGWRMIGAGIFAFSFLLDRADGELARLSGKSSPFGHKLDLVGDAFSNAIAFAGLGIGLRAGEYGAWSPVLGLLAGLAVAGVLSMVWRLEAAEGARSGELGTLAGIDADDGMLAVPVFIWLGHADLLLALAAVGAPLFCLALVVVLAKRAPPSAPPTGLEAADGD